MLQICSKGKDSCDPRADIQELDAVWCLPSSCLEIKRRYIPMQIRKSYRILAAALALVMLVS